MKRNSHGRADWVAPGNAIEKTATLYMFGLQLYESYIRFGLTGREKLLVKSLKK